MLRDGSETKREVVLIGDQYYAVASIGAAKTLFAIPPDGEPTGRLWARLEKKLENWQWLLELQ